MLDSTAWYHLMYLQLAYLEQHCSEYIDAIYGSSEVLLFDVDKVITKLDLSENEFTWVRKRACLEGLGNVSANVFIDACMLAGSSFLPTLPQLSSSNTRKPPQIKAALELMNSFGRSGIAVCLHYQDDPQLRALDYLDRYRKSRLAIKHHAILTKEGKIELLDSNNAPGDSHEFIGQRMPDEAYYYLSKGLVSPRVLNWRTTGEISQLPPLDNGESDEYHRYVQTDIVPLRMASLAALSYGLHRFYVHNPVLLRVWFDRNKTTTHAITDTPDPRPLFAEWNVKEDIFASRFRQLKGPEGSGMLGLAVGSLEDAAFAKQTKSKKDNSKLLGSREEVLYNTVWRFLQVRGYIEADHSLSAWGKALNHGLKSIGPDAELQEAVLVAVELLRLNLFSQPHMLKNYSHAPIRGNDNDRKFNILVSRIASLGPLRHKAIGFTGPLSRHLLGYHSFITTMRQALRDLEEMCLLALFMGGGRSSCQRTVGLVASQRGLCR
jgi:hypothetical protein